MPNSLAILLTCFNRKIKTLECLENLYELNLPGNINEMDVYLVDDGSTDGTSEAVKKEYAKVNVIQGNGSLFWNQGMRLAWIKAEEVKSYDFFLWLNDDVVLEKYALIELMECFSESLIKNIKGGIITGAFKNSIEDESFSYGGRTELENVIPNSKLQSCKYINGNAVLVSKEIYSHLGNLSPDYTHAMGDFDYGLRSLKAGFKNFTTKRYIGICPRNEAPQWSNPDISFKNRIRLFNSPQGLNYTEYIIFRKKFWGSKWVIFAIKAYMKVLFPSFYNRIKAKQ